MTTIIQGEALEQLRLLPADSVHCVVTSVPYFQLRSYLPEGHPDKAKEIGLESTLELWVARLVSIFQEVRRVLHPSGTLWLNCGDAYAGSTCGGPTGKSSLDGSVSSHEQAKEAKRIAASNDGPRIGSGSSFRRDRAPRLDVKHKSASGLKEKNLMGLAWRLALALQDDGWILRSEITWIKKSPMPESVLDRPTNATEKVFLMAKEGNYYYDSFAVREKQTGNAHPRGDGLTPKTAPESDRLVKAKESFHSSTSQWAESPDGQRNMRNYWILGTEPYPGEHYAVFPTALPRRCILAGTSAKGVCPRCLAPWERIIEEGPPDEEWRKRSGADSTGGYFGQSTKNHDAHGIQNASDVKRRILEGMVTKRTIGWQPTCECANDLGPLQPIPATVLDCFAGTFTTCEVAMELGRSSIGIELSEAYCREGRERLAGVTPGFPNFA
jgi:DNA modification methylase